MWGHGIDTKAYNILGLYAWCWLIMKYSFINVWINYDKFSFTGYPFHPACLHTMHSSPNQPNPSLPCWLWQYWIGTITKTVLPVISPNQIVRSCSLQCALWCVLYHLWLVCFRFLCGSHILSGIVTSLLQSMLKCEPNSGFVQVSVLKFNKDFSNYIVIIS